ncbi:hypothetical protein BASA60_000286 [Batrachochytrium salamandrivorans]|nr:hypothetical protein BASA60_000286 [Batrachochytrium salamandrivorans]
MRQLQLPVELLQLVFSYVSQHRYLPCSSGLDQRQDQGHEQWRGQDLSNPFAVVAEEEPLVLDLTGRSARLCEFDLCKPPIRKRHNLVTNPDAKVGPIFKNARTIVNITTKANQRGRAMGFSRLDRATIYTSSPPSIKKLSDYRRVYYGDISKGC